MHPRPSRNGQIRSAAERVAVNLPIQGTAADIMKQAMIDVHAALQESGSGVFADLVTRPTGRFVRAYIERALASVPDAVAVTRIDFTGVGCIDYSCADEIVAKLLRDRPAPRQPRMARREHHQHRAAAAA